MAQSFGDENITAGGIFYVLVRHAGQTRFATGETADGRERMMNPNAQSEVRLAPDQKPPSIEGGFLFSCA
jgi:hypothetical protein